MLFFDAPDGDEVRPESKNAVILIGNARETVAEQSVIDGIEFPAR